VTAITDHWRDSRPPLHGIVNLWADKLTIPFERHAGFSLILAHIRQVLALGLECSSNGRIPNREVFILFLLISECRRQTVRAVFARASRVIRPIR
jgi:hypothetical protein